MGEQMLHMTVGLTDTYLANHLKEDAADATAAIGVIGYLQWFVSLIVGLVASGATALISRAIGARDKAYANHVAGQSALLGLLVGVAFGLPMLIFSRSFVTVTGLQGEAAEYAAVYFDYLAMTLPAMTGLLTCSACLRGAGDSMTPAQVMIGVNISNVGLSVGLVHGVQIGGVWVLPQLGFEGIPVGTMIAYMGGILAMGIVMFRGKVIRLYLQEMKPRAATVARLTRIGVPAAIDGSLVWAANFAIPVMLNHIDPHNLLPAAHINIIRIESLSFLPGVAFGVAASTLVGQNLGAMNPRRAALAAHLTFAMCASIMGLWGLGFLIFPHEMSNVLASDPKVAQLTAESLYLCGWVQVFFACSLVYGGALRGAGATFSAMLVNLSCVVGLRLPAALLVGLVLEWGLYGVWVVLCIELAIRGSLMGVLFLGGRWKHTRV